MVNHIIPIEMARRRLVEGNSNFKETQFFE